MDQTIIHVAQNKMFALVIMMILTLAYFLLGPKGVINDWRKYKQLEVEQKQEQKREMERLIKKLSMTCRSDLDLEKDKEKEKELQNKIKGKVSWLSASSLKPVFHIVPW